MKPFIASLHSGLLHNNDERRRIRQGSRSASNYVSLSAKGVTRSNRTGSDAKALTSQASNKFSGGRDPWDHYDEDMIEQVETQTPFPNLATKANEQQGARTLVCPPDSRQNHLLAVTFGRLRGLLLSTRTEMRANSKAFCMQIFYVVDQIPTKHISFNFCAILFIMCDTIHNGLYLRGLPRLHFVNILLPKSTLSIFGDLL